MASRKRGKQHTPPADPAGAGPTTAIAEPGEELGREDLLGDPREERDLELTAEERDLERARHFWNWLAGLKAEEWEHTVCYLYRLEPKIDAGKQHAIDKYSQPFDEIDIARTHGGGKYLVIVNDTDIRQAMKKYTFYCAGEEKLRPGDRVLGLANPQQAAAGTPAPGGPAVPAAENVIADVVRQVLAATKGKSEEEAVTGAISVMRKGMEAVLDLQTKAQGAQASSMTGSPLADRVLDKLLARLDSQPTQTGPSAIEKEVMQIGLETLRGGTKSDAGAGGIREIISALREEGVLGKKGGGGADWAGLVRDFVQRAPDLLDRFAALQRESFSRAIAMDNFRRQQRGSRPALVPTEVRPADGTEARAPGGAAAAPENNEEDLMRVLEHVTVMIRSAFDRGKSGNEAVDAIVDAYPGMIGLVRNMLRDRPAVLEFCKTSPALSPVMNDPRFSEFVDEFLAEAAKPEGEIGGGEEPGEEGPAPSGSATP